MEDILIKPGIHYLSGIERITLELGWHQEADGIRFILDGQSYECYEDPDDGWRSYGVLNTTDKDCKYKFPPQEVLCDWIEETGKSSKWQLTMKDLNTMKDVLIVGTGYYDDWYPCAIFEFNPENMKINYEHT